MTVQWAAEVASNGSATLDAENLAIGAFDLDTNTIFAGTGANGIVVQYDSNDRFNVGSVAGSEPSSTYAVFERALAVGGFLDVELDTTRSGSRAVNLFTLTTQ